MKLSSSVSSLALFEVAVFVSFLSCGALSLILHPATCSSSKSEFRNNNGRWTKDCGGAAWGSTTNYQISRGHNIQYTKLFSSETTTTSSSSLAEASETTTTETSQQQTAENDSASTNSKTDSLLTPNYEIEQLPIRIGHGFDIHRMAPIEEAGQPVVIGGVTITHKDQKWTDVDGKYVSEKGGIYETQLGVVAHSDGDVVYHSIVDAIFGALTLPDIGQVFQDTDPRWKGCDSSKFMEHAWEIMDNYGYQVGNIDVTLILERPKVASFKPAMKENIINLLHTTPGRVNIKARTHEQVDSVGQLRSLSCHVVMTLERKT